MKTRVWLDNHWQKRLNMETLDPIFYLIRIQECNYWKDIWSRWSMIWSFMDFMWTTQVTREFCIRETLPAWSERDKWWDEIRLAEEEPHAETSWGCHCSHLRARLNRAATQDTGLRYRGQSTRPNRTIDESQVMKFNGIFLLIRDPWSCFHWKFLPFWNENI